MRGLSLCGEESVPLQLHTLMFTLDRLSHERDVSSESVCYRGCWRLLTFNYLKEVLGYRSSVKGTSNNTNKCNIRTIQSKSQVNMMVLA